MGEITYKLHNGYSIKAIDDIDSFLKLRDEWDGLVKNHTSHVPFLCFDWFRIWLEYFLDDNDLFILLLFRNERPVAIAPFIIREESYKGILKIKKVILIGNVHSPIRNFIFHDPANEKEMEEMLFIIFSFFQNNFRAWHMIKLDSIPEESNVFHVVNNVIPKFAFTCRKYTCFTEWHLDGIDCSGDEYIKKLPNKIRNEITRRKRRLAEAGNVRMEIGGDTSSFERYMGLYYKVRQKSWKSPESDLKFHRDARKMASDNGWLRCGFIFHNSEPIAAQIRLVTNRIVYFMEALHDSSFNKFGPGNILRSELIKYFIDTDHITEINQGRGEESYKEHWTPNGAIRERKGIEIFNTNLKGVLFSFIFSSILPIAKKYPFLINSKNTLSNVFKNMFGESPRSN